MPLSAEDGHRVFEYFRWNMSRPDLVEGGLVRLERPDKWRQIHRRWIVSGPGLFGYRWDQKQIKDIAKYWVPLLFRSPEHLRGWYQVKTSNRALPAPSNASNNSPARATAAELPPELFEYIFRASDVELSRTYRLVCRYWNLQCFAYAFREIDMKKSPERMLDLCNFTSVPMLRRFSQYVKQIKNIPFYDKRSKSPWIHLLSPEWKKDGEYITIQGPFSGGHQTIRSIHFAIPRSPLPASFSRGIRCLRLHRIKFNRFEDMARLAYELSELKQFTCTEVKWKTLPNRPPRRQRRNQLNSINVQDCDPPTSDWSAYISAIVYVYLALYDAASFFPEDLVTAILAASKTMRSLRASFNVKYDHNPADHSRRLALTGHKDSASLTLHTKGRNEDVTVILRPGENAKIIDEQISEWTQLDATYSGLSRQSRFVFGFEDRQGTLDFHSTVVRQMPWLSRHESVLYTITKKELLHGDHFPRNYWFQASLDIEDLKGDPVPEIDKVYP